MLLLKADADPEIKDYEGYTAFDLYNSTMRTTKPGTDEGSPMELYTWGANRNAALGHGDGDDRLYPDQVMIQPVELSSKDSNARARFTNVMVTQIAMSKLHTGESATH